MIATVDAVAEWEAVLDELEQRLAATEQLLAGGTTDPVDAWEPPTMRHPVPPQLQGRAERLLAQHEDLSARLSVKLGTQRNHLRAADHFSKALGQRGGAAYIDVTA